MNAGAVDEKNSDNNRWLILNAWVTMYVIGADLFIVSPLLPQLAKTWQISLNYAGWLVSVFSVAYAITSPFLGKLSDKYGRRQSICCGLLVFSAANLATAYAPSFAMALASRVCAGIAVSAISPSIYAAMGDQAPHGRRAKWIAIAVSGLLTALWTSAPLGALLAHVIQWQLIFMLISLSAFILAWPNLTLWSTAIENRKSNVTQGLKLHIAALLVSPMTAWGAALYGFYTYLGSGLAQHKAVPPLLTSMCFVGWGIGAICGNYLGGWVADKFSADRAAAWSLFGMMLVMTMLALGLRYNASGIEIAIMLYFLALLSYPFQPAQQSRLMQSSQAGRTSLLAWNSSALYAGMTIGSSTYGFLMQQWSFSSLPYVGAVIAGIGVVLLRLASVKIVVRYLLQHHNLAIVPEADSKIPSFR